MERLVLMAAVLLGGCAFIVHATPVSLPDGTQGYAIHCNGTARDVADCMNEAARVCGGKYKIFGRIRTTQVARSHQSEAVSLLCAESRGRCLLPVEDSFNRISLYLSLTVRAARTQGI